MAIDLSVALSKAAPGQGIYCTVSQLSSNGGAEISIDGFGVLTTLAADAVGNAKGPVLVPVSLPVGDWVVRARDVVDNDQDTFVLVVQANATSSQPQFAIVHYKLAKYERNAGGTFSESEVTVKNMGGTAGDYTLQFSTAFAGIIITGNLGPGASAVHTRVYTSISGNQLGTMVVRAFPFGVEEVHDITRILVLDGNDPNLTQQFQETQFEADVIPGAGQPPGQPPYHVPAVGEDPNIVYPVDQFRPAQDVLQALVDSGYWATVTSATQSIIFDNPNDYIAARPSLNTQFPAFFDVKSLIPNVGDISITTSSVFAGDYDAAKSIFGQPAGVTGDPLAQVPQFLEQVMRPALAVAANVLRGLMSGGRPVDPEKALEQALATALSGMGAAFGIYGLATATDLLHPLKGTGIVPTAIKIVDALGTDIFARTITGSYTDAFIDKPLKMHFDSLARPWRPKGSLSDNMFFQGQIDEAEWMQYKKLEGMPDDLIVKYFGSMFTEPSDRLLVAALEDPDTDPAWLSRKVRARGFNEEDARILLEALNRRALDRLRVDRGTETISRFKEGYITFETARLELAATGMQNEKIENTLNLAVLKRDSEFRREQLAIFKLAFQKDVITLTEFIDFVNALLDDPDAAQAFIRLESLRKQPTARRPAIKSAELIAQEEATEAAREAERAAEEEARLAREAEEAAMREAAALAAKIQAQKVQTVIFEFRKGVIAGDLLESRLVDLGVNSDLAAALRETEEVRALA